MAAKLVKMPKPGHSAGIFADISVDGPTIGTLVAIIDRAKNLPNRKTMGKQNPYCAGRLGKEAKKTGTDWRGGQTPKWDQELRFTVHESPDYFKLKVSVFNDDKKTDLIGETWVDLKDLIIPGGSQGDHWHPLQCRGKYAGEVRIEMTYYDTRPEDAAVIERRRGVVDKPERPAGTGGLSGPRQPNDVKRRPLPDSGVPVRPPLPDKVPSAPGYPLPHGFDFGQGDQQPPRHSIAGQPYDLPAPHPLRTYETPDDFHSQWTQDAPSVPAGGPRQPRGRPEPITTQAYPFASAEQYPSPATSNPEHQLPSPSAYSVPEYPASVYSQSSAGGAPQKLRHAASRENHHAEYAMMQPRVEDGEEDEGPPPPPPVHRSGLRQPPPTPYEQRPSSSGRPSSSSRPSSSGRPTSSHSAQSQSARRFPDPMPQPKPVPATLTAGFDPVIVETEVDRAAQENMAIRRNSSLEPVAVAPPYPVEPLPQPPAERLSIGRGGPGVRRKSVSPRPPMKPEEPRIPFSPDSYNTINPNAQSVGRDAKPAYDPAKVMDAAKRAQSGEPGPIIGDDGKEIDPSDHLPTDTWAPEPEKKNKKPEVIIRFKNASNQGSPDAQGSLYKTESTEPSPRGWRRPPYFSGPFPQTPPREGYQTQGTPNTDSPSYKYTSQSPGSYTYSPSQGHSRGGRPIPSKVPIAQPMNQSYPIMSRNSGLEALSQELSSIDIGSVGCSPGRGTKKYIPKTAVTGYAI